MLSALDAIAGFSAHQPHAALAAHPALRCAAERCDVLSRHGDSAMSIERVGSTSASAHEACLYAPAEAEELLVVTLRGLSRAGTVFAAADAHMWWVDRSLRQPSRKVACCVRLLEASAEAFFLYCGADGDDVEAVDARGPVRRLRVPALPFALQLHRLVEMRRLRVSPSVARLVTEVDARLCLNWSQEEVHGFLGGLTSPLVAVRVPSVSLSAVALIGRFYASLRVLHLSRGSSAVFHDPYHAVPYDDEEMEEEEARTATAATAAAPDTATAGPRPAPSVVAAAPTGAAKRPPSATPPSPPPSKKRVATPLSRQTAAAAAPAREERRRQRARQLRLPAGASPVLEELHVTASVRRRLPLWVGKCRPLTRVVLTRCGYASLAALRSVSGLEEVTLEECSRFAAFDFFCVFSRLRSLTIRNCPQLRTIAWLPRLSGALRSLALQHAAPPVVLAAADRASMGVGLDHLQSLSLSLPRLRELAPLLSRAGGTLRALALPTCFELQDFAELPPLPALERVAMTLNMHMRSFAWLRFSVHLVELSATQCTQLASLEGLEELHSLRVLDLTGAGQLQSVAGIAACTQLTYVDVSQCGSLGSVDVLQQLPRLERVLLRNCTRLPKNFEWVAQCPSLAFLMLPNGSWLQAAQSVLQRIQRWDRVEVL